MNYNEYQELVGQILSIFYNNESQCGQFFKYRFDDRHMRRAVYNAKSKNLIAVYDPVTNIMRLRRNSIYRYALEQMDGITVGHRHPFTILLEDNMTNRYRMNSSVAERWNRLYESNTSSEPVECVENTYSSRVGYSLDEMSEVSAEMIADFRNRIAVPRATEWSTSPFGRERASVVNSTLEEIGNPTPVDERPMAFVSDLDACIVDEDDVG